MFGEDNSEKIKNLYNKLVNSMSNIKELTFTNKYITFNLYKAHCEILSLTVKQNILFKFSLLIFRELFEDKQNFKQFNYEKERIINSLLDIIKENVSDNQLNSMISAIIFLNQNNFESLGDFKLTLINKLHIKIEFVYLIFCYMNVKGFNLNNLNEILVPILNIIFRDSIVNFEDALKSGISLDKFLEKFVNIWSVEREFNYVNIKWNDKKNDFSFSNRTVDEIAKIIEDVNSNKNRCKNMKKNVQKMQINDKDKNKIEKKNRTKKNEKKFENKNESKIIINESSINPKENLMDKNDLKKQIEEMGKKYDEKLKEYEIRLKQYEIELKDTNEYINETNEYINDISHVLTEKSLKIEELEFNLKLIGCRTAYKSFIDLFIYLFKLKDTKNLERNKESIETFLNNFKNEKTNKIISLIKDTYYLINDANNVAHFIDFTKNLTTQILDDIAKYTNHYEYLEIQKILENFKIESKFKSLVKLRTEKYKMPLETFKAKEDDIISKIRNNDSNKFGLNLLIK